MVFLSALAEARARSGVMFSPPRCNRTHLRHRVALCHSPRSPLPDHFHRLNPPEGSPSSRHRSVPFGQPRPPFHISVILLDNVVQEFALPQTTTRPEGTFLFQIVNRRRIGAVF